MATTNSVSTSAPAATVPPAAAPIVARAQANPSVAPERAAAAATVREIERDLSSGGFNPVTTTEARSALNRLVDLSQTSPEAGRLAVRQLEHTGALKTLGREIVETSAIPGHGGLPRHELANAYGKLAKNLDGDSLARIGRSLSSAGADESVKLLGNQIANHASSAAKLEFVRKAAVGDALIDGRPSIGKGNDADAYAVASVVGSLRGSYAQTALHSLNDKNLNAVLSASVGKTIGRDTSAGFYAVWRPQQFDAVLKAAGSTGDAFLKARVFGAGVDQLTEIRKFQGAPFGTDAKLPGGQIEASNKVASSLERLLSTDSNGIIEQLSRKDGETKSSFGGEHLTAFIKAEYFRGATGYLTKIATDLATGNDNKTPAHQYLSRPVQYSGVDGVRYENANRLGFYLGSLSEAGLAIEKGAISAESGTNNASKLGLAVLKEIPGTKAIGSIISIAKDATPFATKGSSARPNLDHPGRTTQQAVPTQRAGPANQGIPLVSSAVESAFYNGVIRGRDQ